jgi:hypothetical protein
VAAVVKRRKKLSTLALVSQRVTPALLRAEAVVRFGESAVRRRMV